MFRYHISQQQFCVFTKKFPVRLSRDRQVQEMYRYKFHMIWCIVHISFSLLVFPCAIGPVFQIVRRKEFLACFGSQMVYVSCVIVCVCVCGRGNVCIYVGMGCGSHNLRSIIFAFLSTSYTEEVVKLPRAPFIFKELVLFYSFNFLQEQEKD